MTVYRPAWHVNWTGLYGTVALMTWLVLSMSSTELETGAVELADPESRPRARPSRGDPANDWLCAWCLHRVASEKDRFTWEGRSEFTFANPHGIRFHILTFARTLGCQQAGLPTLAHTWFPGHAWSSCVCGRCGMFLGWYYTGPHQFAGLIASRIVRAALIRN